MKYRKNPGVASWATMSTALALILMTHGCSPAPKQVFREAISPDGQWKIQIVLASRGSLVAVAVISDSSGQVYEERVLDGLYDAPIDVKSEFEHRDVYCTNEEAGVSYSRFFQDSPPVVKSVKEYDLFRRPVIEQPEKK